MAKTDQIARKAGDRLEDFKRELFPELKLVSKDFERHAKKFFEKFKGTEFMISSLNKNGTHFGVKHVIHPSSDKIEGQANAGRDTTI
jgi:hypothetical protein